MGKAGLFLGLGKLCDGGAGKSPDKFIKSGGEAAFDQKSGGFDRRALLWFLGNADGQLDELALIFLGGLDGEPSI